MPYSSIYITTKDEVEAPEIPFVLRFGVRFEGIVNDAERDEGRVRGGDAHELEEPKAHRFEHALLAPVIKVALLNGGAEV